MNSLTTDIYTAHAPYVRSVLSRMGVRDADLSDLCQEVFLVVHNKGNYVDGVQRMDLWLREICRRVVAGHRRRLSNRPELHDDSELVNLLETAQPDKLVESASDDALLHLALRNLDSESQQLLAMHEAGEMPIAALSELVGRDRKTVRSRLDSARSRLFSFLRSGGPTRGSAANIPRSFEPNDAATIDMPHFEILASTPSLRLALCGNVAISVWPAEATVEAFDILIRNAPRVIERCGGRFAYLASVEASVRPPGQAARQKIVEIFDLFAPHVLAYAGVMFGGMAWISQPIMNGLLLLSKVRFPMHFFVSVQSACEWICRHDARGPCGPLDISDLSGAVGRLRQSS